MSLNSLSSLGSLATTAFDTAKSTFKAISDAAVAPEDRGRAATRRTPGGPGPGEPSTPAERIKAAHLRSVEAQPAEKPHGRVGTKLDAYA